MIMIVISFALVKFYAFAILYVLIVMQIKLVVVVVDDVRCKPPIILPCPCVIAKGPADREIMLLSLTLISFFDPLQPVAHSDFRSFFEQSTNLQ